MANPSDAFYLSLIDSLVEELEYNREDVFREYQKWTTEKGDSTKSKGEFFRESFKLGRKHYKKSPFTFEINRYNKLRQIECIYFRLLIEEGRSCTPATKRIIEADLRGAAEHNFEVTVTIIAPASQCQYALQFDGKHYPLSEAIDEFPMDFSKCDRKLGCACCVGFEGVRDENGRLKLKSQK